LNRSLNFFTDNYGVASFFKEEAFCISLSTFMVTYLPSFVFVTSFAMFPISIVIIRLAGIAISKMKPIGVLTK